jgi:hypothetical protein
MVLMLQCSTWAKQFVGEISGSHGGEYETTDCLLELFVL